MKYLHRKDSQEKIILDIRASMILSTVESKLHANKRLNSWLEFWIFVLSTAVIVNNNPSAATPTYHQATNCIGSPTLVSNYSSSIYPDLERCKLGIDQLRCRVGDIKACIPDLEGNVLAICTENICLPGDSKIIEEECLKAFNAYIMIKNITEKTTTSNPLKEISTTENSKPQSEKESGIIIIVYICVSIITFVAVGIFLCYKK
ncbi:uncharacterized protein [Magallana gigas]|uniref:uncharacterized protein isoform X3 n=1 Tax=Magallana gigas TaxID=29159 RepID=UPI00333E4357